MRSLAVVGLTALLAACGGGGGGGSGGQNPTPVCQVVGGTASGSGFQNAALAFDANLGTFATLSPGPSAAGTIGGAGNSRMAGEVAGVAFTRPISGSVSVTMSTFNGGAPVESRQVGTLNFTPTGVSMVCPAMNCFVRDGLVFMGFETLADFDEMEAAVSISNLPGALEVRELCVN